MRRISKLFGMLLVFFLAGCGATPLQTVDSGLTGAWHGECEIGLPVVFNPNQIPEGVERTKTLVPFELFIHEDATVEGFVGESAIEESVLKRNRGDLGRKLNLATDYIITDGYLFGPIVSDDDNQRKEFTIPFNLEDGRVRGSLMWRQEWKYPYPLCRVDLGQRP